MGHAKRKSLPFDKRGSRVVMSTHLLKSPAYLSLSAQAKVLMTLMQIHWRNDELVDYGTREAAEKIPCDKKTAMKAFDQLQEQGFITLMEHALFNSRTQSRSRRWRLNWLPFNDQKPTNEWENWQS
jgi:hypothetical protein